MPVEVKWDDDCPHCILVAISGGWVWDDFHTAMTTAHELAEASDEESIDYVFDVRRARVFPRDVLHKIRRIRLQLHKKATLLIVVGEGTFAQALIKLLESMTVNKKNRIKRLNSLEDTYAFLDETLPSSDE